MKEPKINERFRALIPPLQPAEYSQLEQSILKEGCRDALVLWNGVVVDGHNRLSICQKHKLPYKTTAIVFADELYAELWIRTNQLGRRNLSDDQRAMVADSVAELQSKIEIKERGKKGGRGNKKVVDHSDRQVSTPKKDTRKTVAKQAKVSERRMQKARKVRTSSAKLAKQVEQGEISLNAAVKQIAKEERKHTLKTMDWPKGKYRVIYADPAWQYGDERTGLKESGGVVGQYETETIDQICAHDVKAIAMRDSVLFLWVTSPLIPEGIRVIESWGFKYKASFVWDKINGFNGHYNDVQHELLLIATRGSCVPETETLEKSVIRIKKTKHSKKPEIFRQIIDKMYPSGPRVELYARTKYAGWDNWGNEVQNE